MNKLIEAFRNDSYVIRYLEIKKLINESFLSEYEEYKKSDFSLSKANYENIAHKELFDEYIELQENIKEDLAMIKMIFESGINSDKTE